MKAGYNVGYPDKKEKSRSNLKFKRLLMVEATGIEPVSENAFTKLSTRVAYL